MVRAKHTRMQGVLTLTMALCLSGTVASAATAVPQPPREVDNSIAALPHNPGLEQKKPNQAQAQVENQVTTAPTRADEVKFTIRNFRFEAPEMILDKADLSAILKRAMGRELTLTELNRTVNELTAYCRQHGYPASAAYVPAQESRDGIVLIKALPGRLGEVQVENHSKLKSSVVQGFVNGLHTGDIINTPELETALYNISNVSGTRAVGVLRPGKAFGTSNLTVRIEDGKGTNTVLYVENYGSHNSGRYRYGLQHNMYDVAGTGAKINTGVLLSNRNLHNYYVNYEMLVGHGGTTAGVGVSRMDYDMGTVPNGTGGHVDDVTGMATTISLFGSRPIYHLTHRMLQFNYGYDYKDLHDDLVAGVMRNSKKHSHSAHVGLSGYWKKNNFLSDYDFKVTYGTLGMDSDYARLLNALHETSGTYTKAEFSLNMVQQLGHRSDVLIKTSGQIAGHNLDGSEEFYLGGANGVRAYPQGEGSGDSGLMGTTEFRYYTNVPGLVASSYFDIGHVWYNYDGAYESIPGGRAKDGQTLKGWGLGLAYTQPNDWFSRLDYARRIGDDPNLTSHAWARNRFWFLMGKIW